MGLDEVEIVLAVERHFRIRISDEDAAGCETVGELFDVVIRLTRESGKWDSMSDIDLLWRDYAELIAHVAAVPIIDVTPNARWQGDIFS